jgi:hypothetical protein
MFGGGTFGGGLLAQKDPAAEKAKRDAVSQLSTWLEQMLPDEERWEELPGGKAPDGQETNIIVNQLACREEGCPDVECVITLSRSKPRPKLMFKIYKAAVDLSRDELEKALLQATQWEMAKPKSEAEETTTTKTSTDIYVYTPEAVHGEHAGDCC